MNFEHFPLHKEVVSFGNFFWQGELSCDKIYFENSAEIYVQKFRDVQLKSFPNLLPFVKRPLEELMEINCGSLSS